jgi:hypothetical protein
VTPPPAVVHDAHEAGTFEHADVLQDRETGVLRDERGQLPAGHAGRRDQAFQEHAARRIGDGGRHEVHGVRRR